MRYCGGVLLRKSTGLDSDARCLAFASLASKIVSDGYDSLIDICNHPSKTLTYTLASHTTRVKKKPLIIYDGAKIVCKSRSAIEVWNPSAIPPNTQLIKVHTQTLVLAQPRRHQKRMLPSGSKKVKSEKFGYQVAILNGIAVISAPFCVNTSSPVTYDGGRLLTYKIDINGKWNYHNKIKSTYHNRDNKFGLTFVLDTEYLIVSAPDSNYIDTDVSIVIFYKWSIVEDAVVKDSIIRYRKTTKIFDLGSSLSNINGITAIGMPEYDASADITSSGCAHVYKRKDGSIWGHRISITPPTSKSNGQFGQSVSLASETKLAVSNNPVYAIEQTVYIYLFENNLWTLIQSISDNNKIGFGWYIAFFGESLYVSAVDDTVDSLDAAGSISIYEVGGDGLFVASSLIKPKAPVAGNHFGFSFSRSSDGTRLAVGAKPCQNGLACNVKGSVHIFTKDGDNWAEFYSIESPAADGSDGYGFDVAVEGKTVIVSAPFESSHTYKEKTYFIEK